MELLSLDWLQALVKGLPEEGKNRKTIYDIAGFPRWENVNSNMLAFYLDNLEEHGFGRTFFNAIVNLLLSKGAVAAMEKEIFETAYTVEREVYANTKRIDIVIKSVEGDQEKAWAIIIENKLDASLYNELEVYWNEVKAVKKIGVVLSLFDNTKELLKLKQTKGISFQNILHSELAAAIKAGLPEMYLNADDRHLLFLKDYLQNIQNMTQPVDTMLLEKQLLLYRHSAEEIEKLKEVEKGLKEYTVKSLFRAMESFGFRPGTGYTNVQSKHFYPDPDFFIANQLSYPEYFRFWFWLDDLVAYGQVSVVFELYDKYTKWGGALRTRLQEGGQINLPARIGQNGGESCGYFHLVTIDHYDLSAKDKSLEEQIVSMLQMTYFNDTCNVVELSTKWMAETINREEILAQM